MLKLEIKAKFLYLFYSIIEIRTATKLDKKQKDDLLSPTEFEG